MGVSAIIACLMLYQALPSTESKSVADKRLPPAPLGKLRVDSYPILGSLVAPVTIVEFAEFSCSFCRRFENESFDMMKAHLIDRGRVNFIAVDIVFSADPGAEQAVEAELCAIDSNQFWPMRGSIFRLASPFSKAAIAGAAAILGVPFQSFDSCITERKHRRTLIDHLRIARERRVVGTPTFAIGKTTGTDFVEMERVSGFQSYEQIKALVDAVDTGAFQNIKEENIVPQAF